MKTKFLYVMAVFCCLLILTKETGSSIQQWLQEQKIPVAIMDSSAANMPLEEKEADPEPLFFSNAYCLSICIPPYKTAVNLYRDAHIPLRTIPLFTPPPEYI